MLKASDGALWDTYDVAMLDLDGVVYIGPHAVDGAAEHLAAARRAGMHLAYVTNNASRPPGAVAEHLRELGIDVDDTDVVTSAQAAARVLAERLPDGAPVFVIGGEGLEIALTERGLRPVQDPDQEPAAVVSGFHGDLRWSTVIAGAILVRDGLPWVASNTDLTVPDAVWDPVRATAPWCAWWRSSPVASRWSPASRSRRCSRRRCAGSGASGRWWSATGWTRTSREPTGPATTACS